ncbi:MAG: hypothetical protein KME35_18695 [Aphanocapsa sp. GSE-SYN-MK-11-07L]|jgi:hypothetical protein|nr:hypothetical protein [Aphanocapsa sp. GSE-SYN-MK-11-07L]
MSSTSNSANLLDTLIALRDHYLALVTDAEHQAGHAREQLNHINALLVDQMISPGASAIAIPYGTAKPSVSPAELPPALPAASSPSTPEESALSASPTQAKPPRSASTRPTKPRGQKSTAQPTPPKAGVKAAKVTKEPIPASPPTESGTVLRETVLPLLPPFTEMTKTQAVAKVMEDHAGQVMSLDDIIDLLHGALDKNMLQQERKRMRTIMWRGVDRQRWDKVTGKDSHYTLRTKPASAGKQKPPAKTKSAGMQKKKAGKSSPVNPLANGSSLMGSVEQVLASNQGTPMRAEAIASALYGDLSPARLTEVKKQIADRLAKGAKAKRWQRVPNQLGVYVYP